MGHDQSPPNRNGYEMHEWLIFSSTDIVNWIEHDPVQVSSISWTRDDAWAAHTVERDGKFYWYVTVEHDSIHGKSIADHPTGPWCHPIGKALVTNDMTTDARISWNDIDPATFIDYDGQAYMFLGNTKLKYVKLEENMIEFDGPIQRVEYLPNFTEAPWELKGILNEVAGNSNTNHQAILEYKGKSYFVYHNGSIPTAGGSYRRSVCIDELKYNPDGTLQHVIMTSEGVRAE